MRWKSEGTHRNHSSAEEKLLAPPCLLVAHRKWQSWGRILPDRRVLGASASFSLGVCDC